MYQIIWDFVNNNLIGAVNVEDVYINNLATILTHTGIVLFYVACVLLIIWLFKLFAGLFRC